MAPGALLKPVQELIESGVVPEEYILKLKDDTPMEQLPYMDGHIIDFSLLSQWNPDELDKLKDALSTWGCFQLVNHGMTSELLDEVRQMSIKFFNMPLEEKQKYSSKGKGMEGYGNDNTNRDENFNWLDKLHLQVHPEHRRQFEYWPETPKNFRTTLHEYAAKTKLVIEVLLKALSRSLNLEENRFFELWGNDEEDIVHARINFYPRCPSLTNQVVGLKAHSDGCAITLLLQDKEIEGLQILKDDKWYRAPIIPDALVINVADQIEIASNGIFKSPIHKVVVNPQYDRISIVMLPVPTPEKEIGPLKELITPERPQVFKRFKNYGQYYFQELALGERQINLVKIDN